MSNQGKPRYRKIGSMGGTEQMSPRAREALQSILQKLGEGPVAHESAPRGAVKVEVYSADDDSWTVTGAVEAGGDPGSFPSNEGDKRDVYVFGVDDIDNVGYIKRSIFGLDDATDRERIIDPSGFEVVSILRPGDSYEMTIQTDVSPAPSQVRFTYDMPG